MRKWIAEGRVSGDSLVWREGWDDWLTAGDVFPSLGSASLPPVPAPARAPYAPVSPAPAQPNPSFRPPRRRNTSTMAITIVVVLGLMSVALLVTLIVVMNS